ncbi:Transmembrane GTPase fzo1 [Tolypocladium ophioglossoides CBS 100239]|uniref:Transmembrane GTPase fzo1 n=1 Tax=Tolypocladium ophioglossoides (strain CBS 100239) TaxID=1163406 RepID=A0A0L0MYQ5_TOLOC|nr:Transmembrane GTPase fzo1 [Tolypocladium ophioglossoides CBS 100239]
MAQNRFASKGKEPMRPEFDTDTDTDARNDSIHAPASRPRYMMVGNGSATEHAARLRNMLDADSGYEGSVAGQEHHATTSSGLTWGVPQNCTQSGAVQLHQLWYNAQRATLNRSILEASDVLQSLQQLNTSWPLHYPSVQQAKSERPFVRPGMSHLHSMMGSLSSSLPDPDYPPALRRSTTSIDNSSAESSRTAESRSTPEPRLVSPRIARDFSILKLDLKIGTLHQAELVHSLERGSIASLLEGKISSSMKHLLSLRERIMDTSSKVLITGDLNAGKSTFCNALLRRKVLPEDQQPCTAIFCEVLDSRENARIEEVHAVHKNATYRRVDESTFDVFSLKELEKIVTDNEAYTQCKVYVKDIRPANESLLNNGVVDIALIDAPGLNSDTTKTTAIFARQEEIDVVVFVVSAANHFTQSAKEFIWAAAAEKTYIFVVVNGYDTIRDKERCQKLILDQVAGLSPRTHKESSELVHFVSSNAIPVGVGRPGGSGNGSSGGGGRGDDPDNHGESRSEDNDKARDFETLEQSLRRFVLEKRARSKLAPVRTYLLNILNDVHTLASVNEEVAQSETERVTKELKELEPQIKSSWKTRSEVGEKIDRNIEDTCREVYNQTRAALNTAVTQVGKTTYDVPYPGVLGAFQYADDLTKAMLSHVADAVTSCEEYARCRTAQGVNTIKQLGLIHTGDELQNLQFRPDVMFRRKRDTLVRQLDISIGVWDFVDWSVLLQRQEKVVGSGVALTVAGTVVSRMMGMNTWVDQALTTTRVLSNANTRQLILPGIFIVAIAASAFVLQQIPNSLHPRLASKISAQLSDLDYVHTNSSRISSSVRKVLRFPADNIRENLDQSVKDLAKRRDEAVKAKTESVQVNKDLRELVGKSQQQRSKVEAVNLDAPPPNVH